MRTPSSLLCPLCNGTIVIAEGRVTAHEKAPGSPCRASNLRAAIPTVTHKQAWDCPECGQIAKSNVETGVVFSHNLPGSTRVCSTSGQPIGPLSSTKVVVHVFEDVAEPRRIARYVSDESESVSIHTVSGGSPGLGRR